LPFFYSQLQPDFAFDAKLSTNYVSQLFSISQVSFNLLVCFTTNRLILEADLRLDMGQLSL